MPSWESSIFPFSTASDAASPRASACASPSPKASLADAFSADLPSSGSSPVFCSISAIPLSGLRSSTPFSSWTSEASSFTSETSPSRSSTLSVNSDARPVTGTAVMQSAALNTNAINFFLFMYSFPTSSSLLVISVPQSIRGFLLYHCHSNQNLPGLAFHCKNRGGHSLFSCMIRSQYKSEIQNSGSISP